MGSWLTRKGGRSDSARAARNAALHEQFGADIHRLVWRVMGADQEHEDLVHQIFARLFSQADRVRDETKLRAWVVSVTLNLLRSELRKRRVRSAVVFWTGADPDLAPVHDDVRGDIERLIQLRAVLNKMGAAERIIYVLRHVEGMTIAEIAAVSGYSPATVNRRLAHANKRLERAGQRIPPSATHAKEQGYQPG